MKISINPITYFLLLVILLCGYFNYFLIISIILFIHDLGHLIILKLLNIKVDSIEILPFGSLINTNIGYNIKSIYLFLISISGILMQIVLYLIFYLLFSYGLISDLSYNIFIIYNKLIIIFNLLPIIPLDGSKILFSLLENIISYKKCLIIMNIISIISIIIFIFINTMNLNLLLISFFCLFKTYLEIANHSFIFNKFLLERYIYHYKYKKVKNVGSIKNIYKNRLNFINNEREDKILAKIFDIGRYFWYYLVVCN